MPEQSLDSLVTTELARCMSWEDAALVAVKIVSGVAEDLAASVGNAYQTCDIRQSIGRVLVDRLGAEA